MNVTPFLATLASLFFPPLAGWIMQRGVPAVGERFWLIITALWLLQLAVNLLWLPQTGPFPKPLVALLHANGVVSALLMAMAFRLPSSATVESVHRLGFAGATLMIVLVPALLLVLMKGVPPLGLGLSLPLAGAWIWAIYRFAPLVPPIEIPNANPGAEYAAAAFGWILVAGAVAILLAAYFTELKGKI